jgi:hypothetical protein
VPQAFNLKRFLIPEVRHEYAVVKITILPRSLVLNQDLQDFEDFLKLGVVWESARRSIRVIFPSSNLFN